ncbi:conserved hypothetical protein, partial [Ricinus communis]
MHARCAFRIDDRGIGGRAERRRRTWDKTDLLHRCLELIDLVVERRCVDTCAVVPEHGFQTHFGRRDLLFVIRRERLDFAYADTTAAIGCAVARIHRGAVQQLIRNRQCRVDTLGLRIGLDWVCQCDAALQRTIDIFVVLAVAQTQRDLEA